MKKLVLVVLILGFMVIPVLAIETTLDTPLTIVNPATIMKQYSFTIIPAENRIEAQIRFVDVSSNTVQIKNCEFVDPAVTNALITSGKVGQKYTDVLAQFIQTKCKGLWNITGVDN